MNVYEYNWDLFSRVRVIQKRFLVKGQPYQPADNYGAPAICHSAILKEPAKQFSRSRTSFSTTDCFHRCR